MASPTCCSISGLKSVTGRPQRGKSWHFAFPVWKQLLFFAQQPVVLLATVALKNIARTYVDDSHLLFLDSKEFYHSMFSVMHVTDRLH
jgi:hypothetical protein